MRYGSEGNKTSITITKNPLVKKDKANTKSKITDIDWPTEVDGRPDFGAMTPDQRLAYHTRRLSL